MHQARIVTLRITITTARSRRQAAASTAACGEPVPVDARVSAVSVFEDLPTAVMEGSMFVDR
jgi:hypothetical protein